MKKILAFLIVITCFSMLSCTEEEPVNPKFEDDWESPVG
jgi:hypothetical protein